MKQPISPPAIVETSEYQQRKAQAEQANGQRPEVTTEGETVFTFDSSSAAAPVTEPAPTTEAIAVEPTAAAISEEKVDTIPKPETPEETVLPAVVEASVVVVEPKSDQLSIVSEEHTTNEDDDEVEKSERFDTFAADRPLFGTGHGQLGRRPSEPLKTAPPVATHVADRRYSAFDRPSSTGQVPPLKAFQRKPDVEGGIYRGRVDSASAAAIRKSEDDSEPEDEFGYTESKYSRFF